VEKGDRPVPGLREAQPASAHPPWICPDAQKILPVWEHQSRRYTKLDISQKLARWKDTPSQQNHAAVYAKIFFNWAISEGCLETNPLQHYKQGKKVRRKRILTNDELRAVWSAAGELGGIFGVIVQLIMLTGQRRGEIAALLESYYSHNQQTVTLPGELTKNHLEHTFPVGAMAVGLITAQIAADRRESKFLFLSAHPSSGRSTVGQSARRRLIRLRWLRRGRFTICAERFEQILAGWQFAQTSRSDL
jgi:integrase